jgi:hypothetical protein
MLQNNRVFELIWITLLLLLLTLSGCNSLNTRVSHAEAIASKNGFIKKVIPTEQFNIFSFQKTNSYSDTAVIYIEGDGLAWINKHRVSNNPTPLNPVALKLATIDSSQQIIYLARPCQYINIESEKSCNSEFWTNKRVSSEVINAFNIALDNIKHELNINKFRIVGYSGGGSIATILAAIRNDVLDLRTIAGNLDIDTFSKVHNVSPLIGSLNPIDYAYQLVDTPQLHFISKKDSVITNSITNSFINQINKSDKNQTCINVLDVETPTHSEGWDNIWREYHNYHLDC